MKKSYKLLTASIGLFIGLIMVTGPIAATILAKSNANYDPVIIQFGNDSIVVGATKQLKEALPEAQVVKNPSSQKLMFTERLSFREIILVAHGTEEGIQTTTGTISWSDYEAIINQSPSNSHYLLTCYSGSIENSKTALTFGQLIDAELAVCLTLGIIKVHDDDTDSASEYLDSAFARLNELIDSNGQSAQFLGPYLDMLPDFSFIGFPNRMSAVEAAFHLAMLLFWFFGALCGMAMAEAMMPALEVVSANFAVVAMPAIVLAVTYLIAGLMDLVTAISKVASALISLIPEVIVVLPSSMEPWDWVFFSASLIASLMAIMASAFSAVMANLIIMSATFIFMAGACVNDYSDEDTWVG